MPDPALSAESPAIEVTGLTCGYDGSTVLKEISFTVKRGEVFFVIGGSGCGKSTLLRNLIGLHVPLAGTVRYLGQPFTHADLAARRAMLKTVGVLYQGGALWSSLTLRQTFVRPRTALRFTSTPVRAATLSRTWISSNCWFARSNGFSSNPKRITT